MAGGERVCGVTVSPHARAGLYALVLSALVDQLFKVVMIYGVKIADRGAIHLGPWMDLVMAWNPGISFGLFPQETTMGQAGLMAVKVAAVLLISLWLARAESRLTAVSLGLIAGGAVGNAIDRVAYGAVADFFFFHIRTETWAFNWYVFNLADVAIVAGVAGLLYESLFRKSGPAANST